MADIFVSYLSQHRDVTDCLELSSWRRRQFGKSQLWAPRAGNSMQRSILLAALAILAVAGAATWGHDAPFALEKVLVSIKSVENLLVHPR
jgi:hypothetical protein